MLPAIEGVYGAYSEWQFVHKCFQMRFTSPQVSLQRHIISLPPALSFPQSVVPRSYHIQSYQVAVMSMSTSSFLSPSNEARSSLHGLVERFSSKLYLPLSYGAFCRCFGIGLAAHLESAHNYATAQWRPSHFCGFYDTGAKILSTLPGLLSVTSADLVFLFHQALRRTAATD